MRNEKNIDTIADYDQPMLNYKQQRNTRNKK